MANRYFLDQAGLQNYDAKIKLWANGASQKGYKKVIKSADGNKLYFFTDPNATLSDVVASGDNATPYVELGGGDMATQLASLASVLGATWDSTANSGAGAYVISLANGFTSDSIATAVAAINDLKADVDTLNGSDSTTGSVAKAIKDAIEGLDVTEFALASKDSTTNVITIKGIKEVDGEIAVGTNTANDIELAAVAATGAAADVAYSATIGSTTVTNVDDALDALASATAAGAVYMASGTPGADYAAVYNIYQGNGSSSSPVQAELVGTINIPKDQFVDEATLVDVTFDDVNSKLMDSTTDVTSLIVGSGVTPTSADAGKYVKLVFAVTAGSAAKSTIYIPVKSLVDIYTAAPSATEVQVAIDANTNVVSASIVDVMASKITYQGAYVDSTSGDTVPRVSVASALDSLNTGLGEIQSIPEATINGLFS